MKLAGRDATAEYDPVHPPGTLEDNLKSGAKLGRIAPSSVISVEKQTAVDVNRQAPPYDQLLNLSDIELYASRLISKEAHAFFYSAADDLISKRLNNEAYRSILLRPRIFVDCERCDLSTTLLGHQVGLPVYVSPTSMGRLAHSTGEAGIAQACGKYQALQIISNHASMTPEQVVEGSVPGQVFGWQLYAQVEERKSEKMLARINNLADKIKFITLTLDAAVPGKREDDERINSQLQTQSGNSSLPVTSAVQSEYSSRTPQPSHAGIGRSLYEGTSRQLTWARTLPWLAQHTSMPVVLKGIQTHEDAYLASLHAPQVKAIILSNHGGRALDTASPAVHTLLEIRRNCPQVFDKIEVWVDGGIRRGTDVVKALCLGARGVGIGRAALWGLSAGGHKGVERIFESKLLLSCMDYLRRANGAILSSQI